MAHWKALHPHIVAKTCNYPIPGLTPASFMRMNQNQIKHVSLVTSILAGCRNEMKTLSLGFPFYITLQHHFACDVRAQVHTMPAVWKSGHANSCNKGRQEQNSYICNHIRMCSTLLIHQRNLNGDFHFR